MSVLSKRSIRNISGENDIKEIPVPIPNTEVKLYVPKILGGFLPGKIGLRQFFYILGIFNLLKLKSSVEDKYAKLRFSLRQ